MQPNGRVAVVLHVTNLPASGSVLPLGSAVMLCTFYFTKKNDCHYSNDSYLTTSDTQNCLFDTGSLNYFWCASNL